MDAAAELGRNPVSKHQIQPGYGDEQADAGRDEQPIMRIEDRLFDRGWVRSAMATRKCGNIYFPKYFMAVSRFLRRFFFNNYLGWRGQNISLKNFVSCTICRSRTVS